MSTKEIIAKLKSLGLDPAGVTIDKLGDDTAQDLVAELGVAMNDGDAEAKAYYDALMEAVNKFDSGR